MLDDLIVALRLKPDGTEDGNSAQEQASDNHHHQSSQDDEKENNLPDASSANGGSSAVICSQPTTMGELPLPATTDHDVEMNG